MLVLIYTRYTSNSIHTLHQVQERLKARAKATAQNLSDPIKIKQRELQAALEIGVRSKKLIYQHAANEGITVTPLLISTGGTLHKTTYQFLKKLIPDSDQRRWLLTDIAIILARARAQIYACNIENLDMATTQT